MTPIASQILTTWITMNIIIELRDVEPKLPISRNSFDDVWRDLLCTQGLGRKAWSAGHHDETGAPGGLHGPVVVSFCPV